MGLNSRGSPWLVGSWSFPLFYYHHTTTFLSWWDITQIANRIGSIRQKLDSKASRMQWQLWWQLNSHRKKSLKADTWQLYPYLSSLDFIFMLFMVMLIDNIFGAIQRYQTGVVHSLLLPYCTRLRMTPSTNRWNLHHVRFDHDVPELPIIKCNDSGLDSSVIDTVPQAIMIGAVGSQRDFLVWYYVLWISEVPDYQVGDYIMYMYLRVSD